MTVTATTVICAFASSLNATLLVVAPILGKLTRLQSHDVLRRVLLAFVIVIVSALICTSVFGTHLPSQASVSAMPNPRTRITIIQSDGHQCASWDGWPHTINDAMRWIAQRIFIEWNH